MAMTLTQDDIDAIAAAILVTPANKLATLANGEIVISPETVVAAYVNNTSPTAQQEIRDAMQFAPTDAGDTQAGSIDDKLDDILVDTGTTIPGLMAAELSNTSDSTASGAITRTRGNSWTINATIGAITGYTSLWLTVKHS